MTKKIITIYTKNICYGQSLAKGLCYKNTGLEIFLVDNLDDAMAGMKNGILVTDYEIDHDPRIITISREDKLKPLDLLFERIKGTFKSVWQGEIRIDNNMETRTIGIFSKYGGLGTTSFSITLARIISAKCGKKVLCLSMDKLDDLKNYINISEENNLSKQEYLFMKEQEIPISINDYLVEDQWGVYYFATGNKENIFSQCHINERLLDYIKSDEYFNYIIIDFGKVYSIDEYKLNKKIEFFKGKGLQKMSTESVETHLRIINFCDYNYAQGNSFYLIKDESSFIELDETIEISMEGKYAQSVEQFLEISGILLPDYNKLLQIVSE